MTDWASLDDADGSAEDVPALLAAADTADADADGPWGELWSRLCNQGTVFSASYAALPALARRSRRQAPSGHVHALHLAAAIIASKDGPEDPAAVRRRHADALAELRAVAEANLPHARDDTEFAYGLQALM